MLVRDEENKKKEMKKKRSDKKNMKSVFLHSHD